LLLTSVGGFKSKAAYISITKEVVDVSNNRHNQIEGTPSSSSQWTEIITQLVDNLTGKNMSITYNFENLTIDLPKAQGPDGRDIGSAKWTINGRIMITAEAHDKEGVS
jgi:hypothetical protein